MMSTIFRDVMTCSVVELYRHFEEKLLPPFSVQKSKSNKNNNKRAETFSTLLIFFAYSSIQKMEAVCSPETSVNFF
jgi:hypothetical protein